MTALLTLGVAALVVATVLVLHSLLDQGAQRDAWRRIADARHQNWAERRRLESLAPAPRCSGCSARTVRPRARARS